MPATTTERASRWPGGDTQAIEFLESRGFISLPNGTWLRPEGAARSDETELETDALNYLIEEWDFGDTVASIWSGVYDELKTFAGASKGQRDDFISFHEVKFAPRNGRPTQDSEWRFQGLLGFGGKFWHRGDRFEVTCYPEDENDQTKTIIAKTNKRLKPWFTAWGKAVARAVHLREQKIVSLANSLTKEQVARIWEILTPEQRAMIPAISGTAE